MTAGEPGGARLLRLARRALLDELLPQLSGDAGYRARLVAKAMEIAARELEGESAAADAPAGLLLRDFVASRGLAAQQGAGQQGSAEQGASAVACEAEAAIRVALRAGALDGDPALHQLLLTLVDQRRQQLG